MEDERLNRILDDAKRHMMDVDLRGRGIRDENVLRVMQQVPRHEFVSEKYITEAYADMPLPVGLGQTISQPYIVALMTQELKLSRNCTVLEIGTASGYQTAILSRLAGHICTVERLSQLSETAQATLGRLGIDNVDFYIGDGSMGWYEQKKFDRIIVTAAGPKLCQAWKEHLTENGLVIAPVGTVDTQQLCVWEKEKGQFIEQKLCDVRFVKLIGEYGFTE